MKPKDLLVELEKAALALDVKVSYESIASMVVRGGLCKVKGHYRVIIDKRLTIEERANTLAKALARFEFSSCSIESEAMSLLSYYAARSHRKKIAQSFAVPQTAAVAS